MALSGREISVAGGGVAGLTVARALALRGARVELREQAPEITDVGAGLQLSPNGMRALDCLGLGATVRSAGVVCRSVNLRNAWTGTSVARLDLGRVPGEFVLIHRARLVGILAEGAREAGVELRLGEKLTPGAGPSNLRIGADGIRSAHRETLNGPGEPFFTGQVAWRALVAADPGASAETDVFMAPGKHLVSYPIGGGLRNIVAVEERPEWTEDGWHHEGDPDALRVAFERFGGPVPEWLRSVTRVGRWGLFRHEVAGRWHDGELILVGDAAHPTLPFLAQGANMALEDAVTLARALDAPSSELAAWEAARKKRTTAIVAAATANARNYHLAGPARMAAWNVLRLLDRVSSGPLLARYRWIYDFDPTTG